MPTPGSSSALVLPGAEVLEIDPSAASTLTKNLAAFLVPKDFTAVAVVHGTGKWASPAFQMAKQRVNKHQGVVWVTNENLLPHLIGSQGKLLRRLLAPEQGFQMTFFSVKSQTVTGKLRWSELGADDIDEQLVHADQN